MSVASIAYDRLTERMAAMFSPEDGYTRLGNPYDLSKNPSIALDKAWGLAIGSTSNSNRILCDFVTLKRNYAVILTRSLDATEHDDDQRDDAVKELLEDARNIVVDFERRVRLETTSLNCTFQSDNGLEFVDVNDSSIVVIKLQFEVESFDEPEGD